MGRKKENLITLSFLNDRGKTRLRWQYNSIRYTLSTSLTYNDENLILVKVLSKQIITDIKKNRFDSTLNKYKDSDFKVSITEGNTKPQKPVKPYNSHYNRIRAILKRWGLFKPEQALFLQLRKQGQEI